MIIVGCSGAKSLAKNIARKTGSYSELLTEMFPDNEIRVRFKADIRNKKIVLVQSFYGNISDKIIEMLLAAHTARELGAKETILVAPHFPYLREDRRFTKGESLSAGVMAKLFSVFDFVFVVDPHLHRFKKFDEFFPNAVRVSAVKEIADYVKNNIKDPVLIGPDEESFQWASNVAEIIGAESTIMKKKRITSRKVKITGAMKKIKGSNVVIVDDIISTGGTMMSVAKRAKFLGAKNVYCIAVHGVFSINALTKLGRVARVIVCNTIPSKAAKIDVSSSIIRELKKIKKYEQKRDAAEHALKYVKSGMTLGLGSGSTVSLFVKLLGERKFDVKAISSSDQISKIAKMYGVPLVKTGNIDLAVDGADQLDKRKNMLKGLGAFAFASEKRLDYAAKRCIIIVDKSKLSKKLSREVLVQIKKYKEKKTKDELKSLGCSITKEMKIGSDAIVYLKFKKLTGVKNLERRINRIDGVIDNGIFANFKRKPVIITGKNR